MLVGLIGRRGHDEYPSFRFDIFSDVHPDFQNNSYLRALSARGISSVQFNEGTSQSV
jgi:hypothetical protein